MRLLRPAHRRLAATATVAVLMTACAGTDDGDAGASAATDDQMAEGAASDDASSDDVGDEGGHGDDVSDDEMSGGDAGDEMSDDAGDGAPVAGVLGVSATAPDGSTFRIADFDGPVLVETFATWCSNCRAQLRDTQVAAAAAGEDAVFLALSVETTLDPAELAAYAADNGFDDIVFGVLDDDGLVTLQDEFGGAVLSPPSTPKFRVDGTTVSELTTGYESSEEILASLGA